MMDLLSFICGTVMGKPCDGHTQTCVQEWLYLRTKNCKEFWDGNTLIRNFATSNWFIDILERFISVFLWPINMSHRLLLYKLEITYVLRSYYTTQFNFKLATFQTKKNCFLYIILQTHLQIASSSVHFLVSHT
jgi:hypothetical protein